MKKILVVGGTGMIASRFVDLSQDKFDITVVDEKTLDITNKPEVEKYFIDNHTFNAVVNFAALTNVDGAEAERGNEEGLAWRLNVEGPKYLAEECKRLNILYVHISTDFVFPGSEAFPGPYTEDAELPSRPDGIGWYGWTKLQAELRIKNLELRSAIVRYGYPFRASTYELKNDWARNLIKLYNEQKLYPLFEDQVQSVIFVDDLVEPLTKIIDQKLTGIFHIASNDTTTPYEIGKYMLEKYSGNVVQVQKGSMVEFLKVPGRTPRPRLGGLSSLKTQKDLNIKFKTWREMIDEFISQISTR